MHCHVVKVSEAEQVLSSLRFLASAECTSRPSRSFVWCIFAKGASTAGGDIREARVFCNLRQVLGQSAVHGAFAGYTGFTPGLLNTHYVFLPIPVIIQARLLMLTGAMVPPADANQRRLLLLCRILPSRSISEKCLRSAIASARAERHGIWLQAVPACIVVPFCACALHMTCHTGIPHPAQALRFS